MIDVLQQALLALEELSCDSCVPRNVRSVVVSAIEVLSKEDDLQVKVSSALNRLESVADDSNMQPITRSQLFNVVSLLESV